MNLYRNIRKAPFLRFLAVFIVGILLTYSFFDFFSSYVQILFDIALCLILIIFISGNLKFIPDKLHDFLIFFLILMLSILATSFVLPGKNIFRDKKVLCVAKVYETPQLKANSTLIPVKIIQAEGTELSKTLKINVYTVFDSLWVGKIAAGDTIVFNGQPERIKNFGNPGEFNYLLYMASKGIFYQSWANANDIYIIKADSNKFSVVRSIVKIRESIQHQTEKYIRNINSRALVIAFITGDRQLISDQMNDAYVNAGVVHILSVSGLHIGIIFMILNFLLKPFDRKHRLRLLKTVIIIAVVWIYALISGMSTSVIRSATMFSLISAGLAFRRDISFYNILAASALIMLFFNPLQLFDVGFQLSYLAVAGIVFFEPKLKTLFSFSSKILNYFYQLLIVSVAAQIATLPLLLYYFNQFSIYFWLANLFIIPLSFVLMMLIVAFLATSFVPLLGSAIGLLCSVFAWIINAGVLLIELIPGSVIHNIYISGIEATLLFIIILLLTNWLEKKNRRSFISGLVLINVFLIVNIVATYSLTGRENITIFKSQHIATIGVFKKGRSFILSNAKNESELSKVGKICSTHWKRFTGEDSVLIRNINSTEKLNFFELDGKKKLVIGVNSLVFETDSILNRGDLLYVATNIAPPKKDIAFEKIILFAGMNKFFESKWVDYAKRNRSKIHIMKEDGAYVYKL